MRGSVWIDVSALLASVLDVGPFMAKEAEVAHSSPLKARCWRDANRESSFPEDAKSDWRVRSMTFAAPAKILWSEAGGSGS